MNKVIQIGSSTKSRGAYDDTKKYYLDNIVTSHGCIFICKVTAVEGVAPVTVTDSLGHIKLVNTKTWEALVDNSHFYNGYINSRNTYSNETIAQLLSDVEFLTGFVEDVQKDAEGAHIVAGDALEMAQSFADTLAQPGGIATLGQDGKVITSQLPRSCVVEFEEIEEGVANTMGKTEASSIDTDYDVVFDSTNKRFLLRRTVKIGDLDGGLISPGMQQPLAEPAGIFRLTQYWDDWADKDRFALDVKRLYICTSDASIYIFNGTTLSPIAVAHLEDAAAKTSETLTDHEQRIVFTELGLGATQEQCRQAHEQLAAMDTIFLKETTFPMTKAGQAITRDISTLRADVDAASSKANRASMDASNALAAASVATQSINAALEKANDAAKDAAAAGRRIDALESATHYEELASEAEWQARKTAGTLSPDKLYYIAEA